MVAGKKKRMNLCTRCIRNQHKEAKKVVVRKSSPAAA
jgi:ribosomal protein L28